MKNNPILYRLSQLISLLLGARIFILFFFTFTLYVSTFFLFNQEPSLRKFVFDYKVHGIIFCAVLSIAAGGIINHFYDREKDKIQKPFRSKLQSFLQQKYFLYSYLLLNFFSLGIAALLSPRILFFFVIYQFLIWFYSHKLSKIIFINNITFVGLSLYPFFGMLVYYQHFSYQLFLMAVFLFLMLLMIDVLKDVLTKSVDKIFGYQTIANTFGVKMSLRFVFAVLLLNMIFSASIVDSFKHFNIVSYYFILSIVSFIILSSQVYTYQKNTVFWMMNFLRFWIFAGVIFMLFNGISQRL